MNLAPSIDTRATVSDDPISSTETKKYSSVRYFHGLYTLSRADDEILLFFPRVLRNGKGCVSYNVPLNVKSRGSEFAADRGRILVPRDLSQSITDNGSHLGKPMSFVELPAAGNSWKSVEIVQVAQLDSWPSA